MNHEKRKQVCYTILFKIIWRLQTGPWHMSASYVWACRDYHGNLFSHMFTWASLLAKGSLSAHWMCCVSRRNCIFVIKTTFSSWGEWGFIPTASFQLYQWDFSVLLFTYLLQNTEKHQSECLPRFPMFQTCAGLLIICKNDRMCYLICSQPISIMLNIFLCHCCISQ